MNEFDTDDIPSNLSDNEHFQSVVDRVVSRRGFLKMGAGVSAAAFLGGALTACGGSSSSGDAQDPTSPGDPGDGAPPLTGPLLGFEAVAANTLDVVTLPEGYRADVLIPWGTALFSGVAAWRDDGSNTAGDQAKQVGDNHDGMHYFPIDGKSSEEGLLVLNHEYHERTMYASGAPASDDDRRKSQHAHGVSVVHIKKNAEGRWDVVVDSPYNRRIHANTWMELTGPAAGDTLMTSRYDAEGKMVRGTINNCGNGFTPWGTYLTCEENFHGYFGTTSDHGTLTEDQIELMDRYGVNRGPSSYTWEQIQDDKRFDCVLDPQESNRFGWIVEIDPFDPSSTPKKRTALGRIKHENCAIALTDDTRVVVYMGDDQAGDYIYKFVSDGYYDPNNPIGNRNLLDSGKLYVARFGDNEASEGFMGQGEWILLDKNENPVLKADDARFPNQAAVLIKTRLAADAVGATKMDRPEWVAVHPGTREVYCTLTNNSGRSEPNGPNPRTENRYGQIVRWREKGADPTATEFEWDLFVLAGNPIAYPDDELLRGSPNVTPDNTFNSPDGLAFDQQGRLWIQTDGDESDSGRYEGQGNNQMLAADPRSNEIRRFLVGPRGCEVTGITWTPDMKTMFINIQHPAAPWPKNQWSHLEGGDAQGRSATVVITKDDGGIIGT